MRAFIQLIWFFLFCKNLYKGKIVLFKRFKTPELFSSTHLIFIKFIHVIYLPTDSISYFAERHQNKSYIRLFGQGYVGKIDLKKISETGI